MAAETKFATLSAHGTVAGAIDCTRLNEIYVTPNNVRLPLENEMEAQDVMMSFNTFSYGATATVFIPPMYKFIRHAYVRFTVEGEIHNNVGTSWASGDLLANAFLQRLAAPSIMTNMTYQFPGMEKQTFKPLSLLQKYLDQIKHSKRQTEFLELMGNQDSLMEYNSIAGNATRAVKYYLYFPVPLESTDFRLDEQQAKPTPAYMLGDSIQTTFTIAPKEHIFKNGAWTDTGYNFTGGVDIAYRKFRITSADMFIVYRNFFNENEYKKVVQKYPCSMSYSQQIPIARKTKSDFYSLNLAGIRQGETTQLTMRLADDAVDVQQRGHRLRDITVWFGGIKIFESPDGCLDYLTNLWSDNPSHYNAARGTYALPHVLCTADQRIHWYNIPIANKLIHMKGAHDYTLGADFNNAELRVDFRIHEEAFAGTSSALMLNVDAYVTSIIQFNGQAATLIQ